MDDVTQGWKKTLDQGGTVGIPVTSDKLGDNLGRGDEATVSNVPFRSVKKGDVVLCLVDGTVELRRVTQSWVISGVACLEVAGTGPNRYELTETGLWGKVTSSKKGGARLQLLMPTAARLFRRLTGNS